MQLWTYTDRFIQERRILFNVSPATLSWYQYSLKAFQPALETEFDTIAALKRAVINRIDQLQSQGRGNKAVSINTYLRCLKAFLNWCRQEEIVKEPLKLCWLTEEQKILPTFSHDQISRIVHWKPVQHSQSRLHAIALTALDTGLRVNELVSLLRNDVDFQNFTLRVKGKGNKQRLVPMSIELRKVLSLLSGR
jgi:site-specific recombinase XerD